MRPTRWWQLVAVAAIAGAAAYLVTRTSYESLPAPNVYAEIWIALLAVAELYIAAATRSRLAGRPGTRPINPLLVARQAALAKASSVVGAVVSGVYAGFLGYVVQLSSPAATRDTRAGALGVAFGLVLIGAALVLEHVCRVKRDDPD